MKKELSMYIPPEIVSAISRRRNGREDITRDEIIEGRAQMEILWQKYQKTLAALNYCEDEWWDKMEVEKHFKSRRWYYAHYKRKKLVKAVKELHKSMFALLVYTDGNYEPFGSDAMYAEDIYEDFMRKYSITS